MKTTMARAEPNLDEALAAAWRTNDRVTTFLVEHVPDALWRATIPGKPRQTIGMLAAHIHNARCSWIRHLGGRHGVAVPGRVAAGVTRRELVRALGRSSQGILDLLELGRRRGGSVPRATWQNFPTDLVHFLSYFVAHEAHHRGQVVLVARQLGHRLREVTIGVWQWNQRARECAPPRRARP